MESRRYSKIPKDTSENLRKWEIGSQKRMEDNKISPKETSHPKITVEEVGMFGTEYDMDVLSMLPDDDKVEVWEQKISSTLGHCRTLPQMDFAIETNRMYFHPPQNKRLPHSMTQADPKRKNIFDSVYMSVDETKHLSM